MHLLEDLALLAADLQTHFETELRKLHAELVKRLLALAVVDDHHHVEVFLNDGLGDVENVDVVLGEERACLGENADDVLADDGDDCFFHMCLYYNKITRSRRHRHRTSKQPRRVSARRNSDNA